MKLKPFTLLILIFSTSVVYGDPGINNSEPEDGIEWGVPFVINIEPSPPDEIPTPEPTPEPSNESSVGDDGLPIIPNPDIEDEKPKPGPVPYPLPIPIPEEPSFASEWNTTGKGDADGGDPLVFGDVSITRNWPEQHESFLTEFDLYDIGEPVTLSRTLGSDTYTIFLDINGDGELSNGTEWLFDTKKDVYDILQILDEDDNGFFDYKDSTWYILNIKHGDKIIPVTATNILGFNWSEATHYQDDAYGKGQYTDNISVSDNHFRITAYNERGMYLIGGDIHPTYGIVMGHLEMTEDDN